MQDNIKTIKKPYVNNNCIGCGACMQVAPEAFEYDPKTNLSVAIDLDSYEGKGVDDAIMVCPANAIEWR